MLYFHSVEDAVEAIRRGDPPVTEIRLPLFGLAIGDDGARALAEAMRETRTVKRLMLARKAIGAAGAKALAEAVRESEITVVDLANNNVGDEGARALAEAIKESGTVTTLSLMDNNVGDEGAKALAAAIMESNAVNPLASHVGGLEAITRGSDETMTNSLLPDRIIKTGGEDARTSTLATKQGQMLSSLQLHWNRIGDEGAKAPAQAVRETQSLKLLRLSSNRLSSEGIGALVEAISWSLALEKLELGRSAALDNKLQRRMNFELICGDARRAVLTIQSDKVVPPRGAAVASFVAAGGDHAVAVRVLRFLLPRGR